jgi:hypothetical protein
MRVRDRCRGDLQKTARLLWFVPVSNFGSLIFVNVTEQKVNEDLSLDKPLHVIYKVSKLAYRI